MNIHKTRYYYSLFYDFLSWEDLVAENEKSRYYEWIFKTGSKNTYEWEIYWDETFFWRMNVIFKVKFSVFEKEGFVSMLCFVNDLWKITIKYLKKKVSWVKHLKSN